jgi:hypothetical protein
MQPLRGDPVGDDLLAGDLHQLMFVMQNG